MKILIVDDNLGLAHILKIMLEEERHEVRLAQLPQLSGYFNHNLLILHNPKKKVVTTNYVLQTSWGDLI